MKRTLSIVLASIFAGALWLGAAVPVTAEDSSVALGADGTIYRLHLGNSAEILPGAGYGDTFLAALEITDLSGGTSWHVVPETDLGQDVEAGATLLFEPSTETLFLVWETRINYIHSVLNLASFGAEGWSDVVRLRGGWVAPRSTPQAVLTQDEYPAGDGAEPIHRMILHLVWWEANEHGDEILYSPVILENGSLVEIREPYVLNNVPPLLESPPQIALADALLRAPTIRQGQNGGAVLVGSVDAATGLLRSVEVRTIPGQLSAVADDLRSRIIDVAVVSLDPEKLEPAVQTAVLEATASFHPSVRAYLTQKVSSYLAESPTGSRDPETLAEGIRQLVLEVGDSLLGNGLVNYSDGLRSRIIDVTRTGDEATRSHSFAVSAVTDHIAPWTPEAHSQLYLSGSGRQALVAWDEEEGVSFIETTAEGWTEAVQLPLSPSLDLAGIHGMLQGRADNR
jgi:hypothetical protein